MVRVVLVASGLGLVAVGAFAQETPGPAQAAMADGAKFEQRKQLSSAADSYKAAVKAAGGRCAACLDALARVQLNMELYKESAATAALLVKESADGPAKARAEYREGLALFQQYFALFEGRGAIERDPKKATASMKQAETVLAQGEADDPGSEPLRMLHGRALAVLKRDNDAAKEFAACAAAPGSSAEECARAKNFVADVGLARGEPAPMFQLKTIDGHKVSLDSMAGKIVLIDFWATWCKFCERDSDYVQSMVDSFDKDKFVLLEVSADESDATWSNYVRDHRLLGLQTRDDHGEMAAEFHVAGYPTYIVVDGNGVMQMRSGFNDDLKAEVRSLLASPAERRPLAKSGGK